MKYWKEHAELRMIIITVCFLVGMALVIFGWKQTGSLTGLGIMMAGLVLLLTALLVYNQRFQD